VVLILGILAAVVVVNVVGLTGRGEAESYAVDERTIQLVVSTFYSDAHAYSNTGGWNEAGNYTSVHNYPTAKGAASNLYLGNETALGKYKVNVVMDGSDGMPATVDDIKAAAIWMALLVNGAGEGDWFGAGLDTAPGDANSPLAGEHGPYLNPLPKSCSKYNSSTGTGTITWIVGGYNRIYGVFEQSGVWYAGFGGRYP
jgi:type II secretory pathway pseudopilin PulG